MTMKTNKDITKNKSLNCQTIIGTTFYVTERKWKRIPVQSPPPDIFLFIFTEDTETEFVLGIISFFPSSAVVGHKCATYISLNLVQRT